MVYYYSDGFFLNSGCEWRRSFTDFEVEEAVICGSVDADFNPINVSNKFGYGITQVCLWIKYNFAKEGDHIKVKWYYEGQLVYSGVYRLDKKEGVKALYLVRDDASPLPPGKYAVKLYYGGKKYVDMSFEIAEE